MHIYTRICICVSIQLCTYVYADICIYIHVSLHIWTCIHLFVNSSFRIRCRIACCWVVKSLGLTNPFVVTVGQWGSIVTMVSYS